MFITESVMTRDVKIKVGWFNSEHRWKRKNLWISAENDWISMRAQPGFLLKISTAQKRNIYTLTPLQQPGPIRSKNYSCHSLWPENCSRKWVDFITPLQSTLGKKLIIIAKISMQQWYLSLLELLISFDKIDLMFFKTKSVFRNFVWKCFESNIKFPFFPTLSRSSKYLFNFFWITMKFHRTLKLHLLNYQSTQKKINQANSRPISIIFCVYNYYLME